MAFRVFPRSIRYSAVAWLALCALMSLSRVPVNAQSATDLVLTLSHTGTSGVNYAFGTTGTFTINGTNVNPTETITSATVSGTLPPGISFPAALTPSPADLFDCSGSVSPNISCALIGTLAPGETKGITVQVAAGAPITPVAQFLTFTAVVAGGGTYSDPIPFQVVGSVDLAYSISHVGTAINLVDFETNSTIGTVAVNVANVGTLPSNPGFQVFIPLQGGLTLNAPSVNSNPNGLFTCAGATFVICTASGLTPIAPGVTEIIRFNVNAPSTPGSGPFINSVNGPADVNATNNSASDPQPFAIVSPGTTTPFPTFTASATRTATPTGTATLTLPLLPSFTSPPTITLTPTRTLIPPIASRTPLPRPAGAGLPAPIPPSGVSVVTNRDAVNVRIFPAIGANVLGFLPAGSLFENVQARSGDNQWVRVDFFGQQGWIGFPVISVIAGDIAVLPIADPRTIPYGGFEAPRAGITAVTSAITGRLADSGLRIRSGPGIGYVILANAPRYTVFPLLGRTADNAWVQVNFEGTLGWVSAQFVEFGGAFTTFDQLPVDGIVADGLPVSDPIGDNYTDTLRLLRARIDLAQPSLDQIRQILTDIALGQPAGCNNFPIRPSNYNIPLPLLSAFNGTLGPLQVDFNAAVTALRDAIDLYIQACTFPQPGEGLIGAGAVSVTLQAINDADARFIDLRARLDALIPNDQIPTENQCLFSFNLQNEVVDRLFVGRAILTTINNDDNVLGFCFDGTAGETYRLEALRATGNIQPQLIIAPFNDPTNFLGVAEISASGNFISIDNLLIPATGQYLVIVNDLGATGRERFQGDLALLLTNTTGFSGALPPGLALDPLTGQVIVNQSIDSIIPTSVPGSGGVVGQPGVVSTAPISPALCPNPAFTCAQLLSCDQARACLSAGNFSLDLDNDGVPCEENLCAGTVFTPPATVPVDSN